MILQLPYRTESDIKRAEWVLDELYAGNDTVTTTPIHFGNAVIIKAKKDTRINTKHFTSNIEK